MSTDKNSKLFFAFAAGALIGAGILALFTTEKGKRIVEKTKGKLGDLSDDMKAKLTHLEGEIADLLKEDSEENSAI